MRHVVGNAAVPLINIYRAARQCLHGDCSDEAGCRLGHDDLHLRASSNQCPRQFSRLVAGDAAGQAENDLLASQVHDQISCGCRVV
jgi:hypothetical protein